MWRNFYFEGLWRSLRILKARGWTVKDWSLSSNAVPGGESFGRVRLEFVWLAPSPVNGGATLDVELPGYARPTLVATGKSREISKQVDTLVLWARYVPKLSVPFSQTFCDKCRPQGGDWFFSMVKKCPSAGRDWFFDDDLPDGCFYSAEQVMTKPMRAAYLLRLEGWTKIARRIISRSV